MGIILEKNLQYLSNKVVLYYAGLDNHSLPFGEGANMVGRTAYDQITYLKTLSLVADYIVVPRKRSPGL